MSEFRTYRVRYCEWQALAINVSARTSDEACELARKIRSNIGQDVFEQIDGAIEKFEAEELDASAISGDPPPRAPTALDFPEGQGGAS
jgi:hypothetical protein